jgi:hypothetical protein
MLRNTKKLALAAVLTSSLVAPCAFADDSEKTGILDAIVAAIAKVVNPTSNAGEEYIPLG